MKRLLAIDLGGSALKAGLATLDSAPLAVTSLPLAFEEDAGGRAEQDPELWWRALGQAAEALAGATPGGLGPVAGIALCGFTRTQIFLDGENGVVRPAIGFRDSRSQPLAAEALADPALAAHPEARHLNGFHPLARLLWLKAREPAAWARTRQVLEPKDYLALRLTGRAATDRISQHRLIAAMAGGPGSLAAAAGIGRNMLPDIVRPQDVVGRVREGLPGALSGLAGVPVFCGSNDTWTAVAGLGALRPGIAYCISGSSEVFGLMSAREATADGLITISWGDDLWQIGGPGQNGANTLDWITDRLNPGEAPRADRLAALQGQVTDGPPILCHPYLLGERTPFWDADLRAAFIGLGAGHGPGDLVRAVMEGVGFVNRTVLERAEEAAGTRAGEIRIAGGGARNAAWNRIRADILGRPLLASAAADMGIAGCLALARLGLGLEADIAAAAAALPSGFTRYMPDAARHARYDRLFGVFRESHDFVARTSRALAAIDDGDLPPSPGPRTIV
ncbi:xylulokinase [Oceanibacterium hippocampi]|uniref:Xylulose kinase n=1 Tax=Oceanibacterium hippocampi TaxID=745714 RepID=A0A1Y5SAM2_9PROT|nr:FGGY-family carbohydrate kinase [Oceanibacterium hippocampi]SLN36383.1 Xylulose kinase [Oceanibacterium hippocampi]